MRRLPSESITALHQAALAAGLDRDTLLAGIDRVLVAKIDLARSPSDQIYRDLHQLNEIPRGDDGADPLEQWLRSALALSSALAEAKVFEEQLARLEAASGWSPGRTGRGCAELAGAGSRRGGGALDWHSPAAREGRGSALRGPPARLDARAAPLPVVWIRRRHDEPAPRHPDDGHPDRRRGVRAPRAAPRSPSDGRDRGRQGDSGDDHAQRRGFFATVAAYLVARRVLASREGRRAFCPFCASVVPLS